MMLKRIIVLLFAGALSGQAQWSAQTIPLEAGWNAIYLQVTPESECYTLFSNTPIKAVYQFNPALSAQYATSPAQPLERDPEWLTWHSGDVSALPPTLFSLQAGQGYLVSNATPYTLVLTGKVEQIHHEWRQNDWHLTGFDVASGVTFDQFFGSTLEQIEKLQRVDSGGVSRDVASSDTMTPGRAYWIKTKGKLDFDGPVAIAGEIWLNTSDATATLTLSNSSTTATNTLIFTVVDSYPSPDGAVTPVPLMRWVDAEAAYRAIPANVPFTNVVKSSATQQYVFKADATGLEAGKTYNSLLHVSGGGLDTMLPVTYVHDSFGNDRAAWPYGLWVGYATLSEVSFVGTDDSVLAPVARPLDIRLILHHDTNGQLRLLSRVVGILSTNNQGASYQLYTDEASLPDTAEQDVFRISSLAFGMMPPLNLSGAFLGEAPSVGHWTQDAQDAVNPYRHLFHHELGDGITISNEVQFTWLDGTNAPLVGGTAWKPGGYCSGSYEQRVTGMRHQTIRTRGTFLLEWVSGTGKLN